MCHILYYINQTINEQFKLNAQMNMKKRRWWLTDQSSSPLIIKFSRNINVDNFSNIFAKLILSYNIHQKLLLQVVESMSSQWEILVIVQNILLSFRLVVFRIPYFWSSQRLIDSSGSFRSLSVSR